MRSLRRSQHAVRVEMTPLIDVMFLLLTFFIYSLVMMVRAEMLPVKLTPLATGDAPAQVDQAMQIDVITLARDGQLYYNRQLLPRDELPARLAALSAEVGRARLFLAMEAQGDVDRGPLFVDLIEQLRRAGIHDFTIVGQPTPPGQEGGGADGS